MKSVPVASSTCSSSVNLPRILVTGLRGGGGKTTVSLGLAAALRKQGRRVAPFKKGPDYIDAAWLSIAAGKPCRNLDLFLTSPRIVLNSFVASAKEADVAVIEGNRGLYDGLDAQGSTSTAEVAKLLQAPVILAVDCTKTTRTVAALVLGCLHLDPQVQLRGVVLNQIAGPRHESVLREAIEQICGLPVLGAIPRIPRKLFPERHLGLVPPQEHYRRSHAIEQIVEVAEQFLDLKTILALAHEAPPLELPDDDPIVEEIAKSRVARIGLFRDEAFQFYYPDNLEALEREGAELIEISPLRASQLPDVDGLYIGGGFPETLAVGLAENKPFLRSLRSRIEDGLPVYAECGGAVYLGETLRYERKTFPMAAALPVTFAFHQKPQGHGYAELETVKENPFFAVGQTLRGHEFHYTTLESSSETGLTFAFKVRRGHGFDGEQDGLCRRNVMANYTHVHALGVESWAPAVVRAAQTFKVGSRPA